MPDATAVINEIVGLLDQTANQAIGMIPQDQTFMELWGWNCPAINRHDFAALLRQPSILVARMSAKEVGEETYSRLLAVPGQIQVFIANSLPHLPSGNSGPVYSAVSALILRIESLFAELVTHDPNWTDIKERNLFPAALLRRLQKSEATIDQIEASSIGLQAKVELINGAHAAAEALPSDMESLKDTRRQIASQVDAIAQLLSQATTSKDGADSVLAEMNICKADAEKIIAQAESANAAATTKGLGDEFGNKARALGGEVKALGVMLAVVLLLVGGAAMYRAQQLHEIIAADNYNASKIWPELILTAGALLAPIWLAWLLTKQIGQRFRLSEDYAFKASVAKAYAGYRAEATRLDPEFEKRLFGTTLDRIDEAPLRYIERESHGSPLQEMLGGLGVLKRKSVPRPPEPEQTQN